MLLKPLILGVSIDFGLLSIALTLRFIIIHYISLGLVKKIWLMKKQL